MSKEAVQAFLKRVSQDAGLQKELLALAAEKGYEFTVDELSDAELGSAVGGAAGGNLFIKLDPTQTKGESTEPANTKPIDT
ncbi:MAG: Nif11 family protein, partial [Gemmatimonadetes bacterium]|nr:Nif11 family protein [Gemmatimonadota bacterium]